MVFDSLLLAAVTDEIGRTCLGGKVERIVQPAPLEIVLTVYAHGVTRHLLLSAAPQAARVHLTTTRRDNPAQPPAFCMLLRKYLDHAWLEEATLPRGLAERILHLEFHTPDDVRCTLIVETMGKHSNIVLVNAAGIVLGAVKIITHEINRVRETRPGLAYVPPPRQRGRRDPFGPFDPASVSSPTPGTETDWLAATFAGVSPLLAQEAVLRAPTPLTAETLWYGLNTILNLVRLGEYAPRVWNDGQGQTLGAYPIPLLSVPPPNQQPCSSISAALDQAMSSRVLHDTFTQAHDALKAALHRTLKARQREYGEVQKGLDNADRADEYQQAGEMLLTRPRPAGAASVAVPDYYAPTEADGSPVTRLIALDPALDGRANAERYFKKARKARDSRASLEARRAKLADETALLTQAESDAQDAATPEDVAAVRDRLAASLLQTRHPGLQTQHPGEADAGHAPQAPAFQGHKIKRFHSPDGWEILVGENATSNDYLTTKIAASSDIWFHVRAAASAHGIIRAGGRPAAVSPAAIRQAAELVAARSEVKHSSLIPVDYTLKKYVRKPRKSAPGAVTYSNEKTISVTGI